MSFSKTQIYEEAEKEAVRDLLARATEDPTDEWLLLDALGLT